MPNKFTAALDSVESTKTSIHFFDAVFGVWTESSAQLTKWTFLMKSGISSMAPPEEKELFWCFIAELSDKDLQECFPKLFSDMYPEQQKD